MCAECGTGCAMTSYLPTMKRLRSITGMDMRPFRKGGGSVGRRALCHRNTPKPRNLRSFTEFWAAFRRRIRGLLDQPEDRQHPGAAGRLPGHHDAVLGPALGAAAEIAAVPGFLERADV